MSEWAWNAEYWLLKAINAAGNNDWEEMDKRAKKAINEVGLSDEEYKEYEKMSHILSYIFSEMDKIEDENIFDK